MANKPKNKSVVNPSQYFGEINTLYHPFVPFENLSTTDATIWRYIARKQPYVMNCITSLIMGIQSLPWTIRAKDANQKDELEETIEEHKKIVLEFGGMGFLDGVDLLLQDYYMVPFGGAIEPVRYSNGDLYSLINVDAATLFPTNNPLFPVIQKYGSNNPVAFKKDELVRMYFPRPEVERRGWGLAPLEKVYLAVELLARGDRYYAQLLLDTPEAGLLDLGDMSKDSALKWLESFRNMMTGIDAFKIPVIYQHTTEAKWIPFGRPPTEMLFDQITFKYAQLVCAAFGITTSDIGIKGAGGNSLAGQMREERFSRATGFASVKSKLTEFFNRILPEESEFTFIDTDDELLVAKGRARSANAVAGRNFVESGIYTPKEWRKQMQADGLSTIPLSEEADESEFEILKEIDGTADQLELQEKQLDVQQKIAAQKPTGANQGGKGLNKQRNVRGGRLETVQGKDNVPASGGGQGEVKSQLEDFLQKRFNEVENQITIPRIRKFVRLATKALHNTLNVANNNQEDFSVWKSNYISGLFSNNKVTKEKLLQFSKNFENDGWWLIPFDDIELAEILESIHKSGMMDAEQKYQEKQYENGLIDKIEIGNIENVDLLPYATQLSDFINRTNSELIYALAFASVVETSQNYQSDISDDVNALLEKEEFIKECSDIFQENLVGIFRSRVRNINETEQQKMFATGQEEQRKRKEVTENGT